MPYSPPPTASAAVNFTYVGVWTATTSYPKYATYTVASGVSAGETRLVTTAYTSGSTYGATDTTNTIPSGPSMATLASIFAPFGASFKQAIAVSGETVTAAMPLQSNGIPIPTTMTITDLEIDMDYPPVGGSCVWRFSRWRYGDPSDTLIGSVTVADGKRSGLNGGGGGLSTGVTLQAGDRILVRNSASNGTTFPGQGATAYIAFGGTLPAMPSPSAATGLTVTPTSSTLVLSWTAGASSTGSLVYRDGIPYQLTGGTTFTDSGLGAAESHTYAVAAVSPGGMSALTGGVAGTTSASFTYWATNGTVSSTYPSDWSVTLGTNAGTAAAVASNIMTMTSGSVGTDAKQDRVIVIWTRDAATHSAWKRSWKMAYNGVNALSDMYFSASAFVNLNTSFTNGIQIEMGPGGYRFGFKAPSIGSGAFQNLTTGTGPATSTATKTASGGNVGWPSGTLTADGAHFIGVMCDMRPIAGDGSQTIYWYVGTTAQLDTYLSGGALPPLDNTITLSSTNRTAMAAGYHYLLMLGAQTTGATEQYLESTVAVTPQSGAGV